MSKPPRAPVAVALLAKDAGKTIGRCLDSIRPFVEQVVIGVDELTTDDTAKVARKHGAIIFSLKVSDWHECEQHGRVLAQHFGHARNETFKRLDPAIPFKFWLDSDDFLVGGEHMIDVCKDMPQQACGLWASYHYATVNNGKSTTTLFDRERLLRSEVGWEWEYRVHECVKPLTGQPKWWVDPKGRISVYHQEGVHKQVASTERNQLLLEIDLEEKGEDARTTFYLANGHFAAGRLPEAIHWYERTTEIGSNPFENWQSFCYASIAYRRLGQLDEATRAAFCAIDILPEFKEPYWRLAEVYLDTGEFAKTLYWDRIAREKDDPPRFVFRNPLDETYNSKMAVADALSGMMRIKEARTVLEEAYPHAPNEGLATRIARYKEIETAADQAQAFVQMARGMSDEQIVALWDLLVLPDDVRAFGRVRDIYAPALMRLRNVA